jgi:hypothetical protein
VLAGHVIETAMRALRPVGAQSKLGEKCSTRLLEGLGPGKLLESVLKQRE